MGQLTCLKFSWLSVALHTCQRADKGAAGDPQQLRDKAKNVQSALEQALPSLMLTMSPRDVQGLREMSVGHAALFPGRQQDTFAV